MPTILDPNPQGGVVETDASVAYNYPYGLNLRPDSELHKFVLAKINARVKESSDEMSKRYPSWKQIDKSLTAYVKTDDYEKALKQKDSRKPVSIVIPYSYATLETLLTYFVAAFLEPPIFKYEGANPNSVVGAFLMQKVVENHCNSFKVPLNLHTLFRDSFAYGIGAVAPTWDVKWGFRTEEVPQGYFSQFLQQFIGKKEPERRQVRVPLAEGSSLKNIDPYLLLLDPNVPAHEPQKGEYVGWIEETNRMKLLMMEQNNPQTFFNVRYLGDFRNTAFRSQWNKRWSESGRGDRVGQSGYPTAIEAQPADVVWLYATIIPEEWKLGTGKYPEKWFFGVVGDKMIVSAQKMGLNHDQYPIAICAPDFDGYSATPISRLEIVGGMQEHLDWLFSSHMTNVRKAINDMLVVDPSLINMEDLKDPQPGKLIRMRRSAWGRGVENAVKQLLVNDITAGHTRDSQYLVDLIQRVTGATDALSGMTRTGGERVTAQETQYVRGSALSRLTKAARIASLQCMYDIGWQFAMNTQQLMSKPMWVRTVGDWEQMLALEYGLPSNATIEMMQINGIFQQPQGGRMRVSPQDLMIDLDLNVKDGSVVEGDNPQLWQTLFQSVASQPALFQNLDVVRIFMHTARVMGAKDIREFVLKSGQVPQIQPAQQGAIDQGVQQGNLVPLPQGGPVEGGQ